MRLLLCKMLLTAVLAAPLLAETDTATLPPGFPVEEVRRHEQLHSRLNLVPHTKAQFEQQRTMPSGRVLHSRGVFEFRRGVGMMWRTEAPVRTAMIISGTELTVYGSRGQELRRTRLEGSPFARYSTAFLGGVKPADLSSLSRAFYVTGRESGQQLVLGMQARRDEMDLRWLMVEVDGGNVTRVEFYSARQGRTAIQFKEIKNSQEIPATPFRILER